MTSLNFLLADDAATARFGETLALALRPGDLVLLNGDLGAGKTALARAAIRALLNDPDHTVPSPSFALVQPYAGNGLTILHVDLYRLRSADEIDELGDLDDPASIVFVEWPDRDPALKARADFSLDIATIPNAPGRRVSLTVGDETRRVDALLARAGFTAAQ